MPLKNYNAVGNSSVVIFFFVLLLGYHYGVTTITTTVDALAAKTATNKANSWQKRLDRAFLQVDGVTSEGRIRSFQRALKDPNFPKDVSKAVNVIREKGFGKGHPEFIELLWPEGTQARKDLEAINALLTKQLPERRDQFRIGGNDGGDDFIELIRSTQKRVRFGDNSNPFVEKVRSSDPEKLLRLAENVLRNKPAEVESPSYELLGKKYSAENDDEETTKIYDEGEMEGEKKKSFLTVAPLELRRYDAFQAVSVPLLYEEENTSSNGSESSASATYTLQNMGTALTEIFSYLELGDNAESALLSMTAPFFISDNDDVDDEMKKGSNVKRMMFAKIPTSSDREADPPRPTDSSRVEIMEFPKSVLATLSFAGICTDEEIDRQKTNLIKRIEDDQQVFPGWKIKKIVPIAPTDDADDENKDTSGRPEFLVLQYNAPGTLPWRRVNEIAVVMEKTTDDDDDDNEQDTKNNATTKNDDVVDVFLG